MSSKWMLGREVAAPRWAERRMTPKIVAAFMQMRSNAVQGFSQDCVNL
jgi:hypothetical protein